MTRWMNLLVAIALITVTVSALIAYRQKESGSESVAAIRLRRSREAEAAFRHPFDDIKGQSIPVMTLRTVDGTSIVLNHGKPIVFLVFNFKYCPPCIDQAAALNGFLAKYRKQGLLVIGIIKQLEGREVTPGEAMTAAQMNKVRFPVVLGDDAVLRALGNVQMVPVVVYVRRDGTIAEQTRAQTNESTQGKLGELGLYVSK